VGSNPTLSATTFIYLYLGALVSIMVSALVEKPLALSGRKRHHDVQTRERLRQ
jgi:hypothetical protein